MSFFCQTVAVRPGVSQYQEIATNLARQIEQRVFLPGDKLPSVRGLGARLGKSAATIFAAYGELERQGLVEAKPQSGFYVRMTAHASAPALRPVQRARHAARVDAEDLTLRLIESAGARAVAQVTLDEATPHVDLLPCTAIARAFTRAVRLRPRSAFSYAYPPGHHPLRRILARRSLDWGCALTPDEILMTSGASDALKLALMAVTRPGDIVAVESPTYYGALLTIHALGLRALEVPTDAATGLQLPDLERLLKRHAVSACFVMPNYSNPIGSAMSDERKRALVEILARRSVPLIEDDVAGDLYFGLRRPPAAKAFDRHGLVLLCSSLSKTLAPGLRLGWLAAGRFHEKVLELQWASNISASSASQMGLAEYLRAAAYDRHLRGLRARLLGSMHRMTRAIERYFPAGTVVTRPQGGLVLWVELPADIAALTVYERALARGVAVMPGTLFAPRPVYHHHLRLSFAAPWSRQVERAIAIVGEAAAGGRS
jgi:DNA-binding transcriptional MocR family regulator